MKRITGIISFVLLFLGSSQLFAVGTFIPASNRIDVAHDFSRNLIYISNGSQILRYDVASETMLTPVNVGGTLSGMDISPDGNTLAVADQVRVGEEVFIHLVDLDSMAVESVSFPRAFYEGGSWTVVYTSDGQIVVTTRFEGSGWVPMRLYDPGTQTTTVLDSVRQNTMLSSSGDRKSIGFVEFNISSGPVGKVVDRAAFDGATTGWFNYEVGVNHDGTQYSVPTYGGTFVYDFNWDNVGVIGTYAGEQPMGVAYHPVEDVVYYTWARTQDIRVFNTNTLTQIDSFNFEDSFTHPGNWAFRQGRLKLAADGSMLLATVTGGVRYLQLYTPLTTTGQDLVMDENTSLPIVLSASVGNNGNPEFNIVDSPLNGTLSGVPPNLVYTPNADFVGQDSFFYQASYGKATVEGVVNVEVVDSNNNPIANDDVVNLVRKRVRIPVLNNDFDPDGDTLQIVSISTPDYGTATIINDNTQIYYRGKRRLSNVTDYFTYTISDGNGGTATATVEVTYP